MPDLEIPSQYHQGLSRIRELSDHAVDELAEALKKIQSRATAVDDVAAIIKDIEHLPEIVPAIQSVYQVRAFLEQPLARFIRDLCDAMMKIAGPIALKPEERLSYSRRMEKLLDTDPLLTYAKARSLKWNQDLLFHDAKILTDMRPVFGDTVTERIGFVVIHTLKLELHALGGHKEMYLGLDEGDLVTLKKVIERAEQKAASLKETLRTKSLKDLT